MLDEVVAVSTAESMAMARRLSCEEGLLVGFSSGAAVHVALEVAKRAEFRGRRIVVILASYGERYLSTPLFDLE